MALGDVVALILALLGNLLLTPDGKDITGELDRDILLIHAGQLGHHLELGAGLRHLDRQADAPDLRPIGLAGVADHGAEQPVDIIPQADERVVIPNPGERILSAAA